MRSPRITVVGSLVADLCVWVPHFPRPHETMPASRFELHPGGKGFNQALTAQRCGGEVTMVGRVGDDPFADPFFELMRAEGMDSTRVLRDPDAGTSLGIPMIDPQGDNSIILVSRANLCLSSRDVADAADPISSSDLLLLQCEVPIETSVEAARRATGSGARVIFNPAPVLAGTERLLPQVDWLIPNEIEAGALTGLPVEDGPSALEAARALLAGGAREGVIITLGDRGAVCVTAEGAWHARPFCVEAVDPTGAGDAFCGAFGVATAQGLPPREAVRFGCAAGALSTTRPGATPSLPRRESVLELLSQQAHGGTAT